MMAYGECEVFLRVWRRWNNDNARQGPFKTLLDGVPEPVPDRNSPLDAAYRLLRTLIKSKGGSTIIEDKVEALMKAIARKLSSKISEKM